MQNAVSQRLKMLRRHFDLTQEKFAEPLGVSEQVYLNMEKGRTKTIGIDFLGRVCEYYKCDWDWLTKGEGEMMRDIEKENAEVILSAEADEPKIPLSKYQELEKRFYILQEKLERLGKNEDFELTAEDAFVQYLFESYKGGFFGVPKVA